ASWVCPFANGLDGAAAALGRAAHVWPDPRSLPLASPKPPAPNPPPPRPPPPLNAKPEPPPARPPPTELAAYPFGLCELSDVVLFASATSGVCRREAWHPLNTHTMPMAT